MSARIFTRLPSPFRAAARGPTFARYNSSTSSSPAARLAELARTAEKPSALEASVPVMWAVSGALIWTAFQRIERDDEGVVEKLLVV